MKALRVAGAALQWRGLWYLALGFAVVAALVLISGASLTNALGGWFNGAFGSGFSLVQTLAYATPIALVALGAAAALKAGIVTVGAEGQMIVGAICATVTSFSMADTTPLWVGVPVGALAGTFGGVLWSLAPAIARARWGVNEILFTLLMNYVAISLLNYLLRTHLRDSDAATPQSVDLAPGFVIPLLPLPGRLHVTALLVLAIVVLYALWSRTRSAFTIDLYGHRPRLAARLGLSETRAVLSTMLVSGAAAGLAGWMQLAGVDGRLQPGVSAGIGFAGLAVAVLGRGNAFGILAAAIVYASLTTGATGIQLATGTTPASIGTVTQGVLLFAAALSLAVSNPKLRALRLQLRRGAPPDVRAADHVVDDAPALEGVRA